MPDFWLPLTAEPLIDGATARLKRPNTNFLDLIGRVRPESIPKSLEAKLKVELYYWLANTMSPTWSRARSSFGNSKRCI